MLAIALKEFKDLFKSVKSIIIILFILSITFLVANLSSKYNVQLSSMGSPDNIHSAGLMIVLYIFFPFFISSLSHNTVNQEVSSRTIRFLATKTSRNNIIVGKFIGVMLFWFICSLIANLLILPFSQVFYTRDFIESLIFISYFVSFTLLMSTLFNKPSTTMFLGIVASFYFSIIGIWGLFSDKLVIDILSKITPYFYFSQDNLYSIYIILSFTVIFLFISLNVMRRKEL